MYLVLLQNEENKMLNNLKDHKIRKQGPLFPKESYKQSADNTVKEL